MTLETVLTTEVVKGLVGLGVKVFSEMTNIKVDEPFKQLLFNATHKYVQTYTERHGHVQVLGMSKPIPLDDIYSGARMLDSAAMKNYASQADLEKIYRNRGVRRFREYDCPRNGIEIATENARLIVLGDPGVGKSTFLRKVGLEALKGKSGDYQLSNIPVFLELKRFRTAEVDLKLSIAAEFESCGFPSAKGFIENALKKGQLLLLFDGLDEVPTDNLNNVIENIQDLVDRYSGNRFIASCRIAAYHTYFKRVSTVAIAEFDDDQIKRFIHNWFFSELDQENQTAEQCWELLQQPENQGAKELAQSPLLLTFLCMVYNKSLRVPRSRTSLYEDALNILLKEWASEKRVGQGEIYEGFHSDLEKELLAKIAYEGFENDQLFFSKEQLIKFITEFLSDTLDTPKSLNASAVLDAIEVQQGILVERAANVYSFSHLTLQEFLAAKYIVTWNLQEDLVNLHALDNRWKEVFFLISGLMKGAAIGLLQQLERKTQGQSKHPKLMGLLAWTEVKTTHSTNDYSVEIKRVFAFSLIVTLALALARAITRDRALDCAEELDSTLARPRAVNRAVITLDRDRALSLGRAITLEGALKGASVITLDLDHALEPDHTLDNSFKKAHDLDLDLSDTLDLILDLTFDFARALAHSLDLALIYTKFALDRQMIIDVDLQYLISYLDKPVGLLTILAEEFITKISSSLDISPEFLDLSKDDVQEIANYISTCQLLVDCSKQASGLSAKDWNAIQQRMFLPPQPKTHENSSTI